MNLAIPVVAFFLRSAGGFFIERSFAGKGLHPAIFARYLRELVRHGAPLEFYMEGGRTRSGKLLAPKVGVLEMVFDAAEVRPSGREVTLLPVALAYEQVAEQRSYVRELGGQKKRKENLGEVARASRIVGRRLGRVYLRVGEPVAVGPLVDGSETEPAWSRRTPAERRALLERTARGIMHEVGRRTVLLPTTLIALALLSHHRRGIRQVDLIARARRLGAFLEQKQVPAAASLERFDEAMRLGLARLAEQRTIEHFEHAGERVWAARVERRLELDFAKNQGIHAFATAGLVICALRAHGAAPATVEDLTARVAWLSRLWRREFICDPDLEPADLTLEGLRDLATYGAIHLDDEGAASIADRDRAGELYGIVHPFIEAYQIVAELAPELGAERLGRKEWVAAIQRRADALLAAGAVSRPESLSLVTLENAVKTFLDDRTLATGPGQHLVVDADRLAEVKRWMTPMADR